MRFTKCFMVLCLCLCLFMGNCSQEPQGNDELDIDIGDYENHLEAWNSQNMLDYQIKVYYDPPSGQSPRQALIIVRGGIPESGSPIPGLSPISTIPELYSWFEEVKSYDPNTNSGSFKVSYNTEYHYPNQIIINGYSHNGTRWQIFVMPLEEGELDIDIGDYEYHLEAWNSQNMLDYQLKAVTSRGDYYYDSIWVGEVYNVKNGIPDDMFPFSELRLKEGTVSGIYVLINEQEKRIRNVYNGINRSYLCVQYNTEYHYPTQISLGVDQQFGYYERWKFTLTPEETE